MMAGKWDICKNKVDPKKVIFFMVMYLVLYRYNSPFCVMETISSTPDMQRLTHYIYYHCGVTQ